jgi:hypothetical protein
MNSFLPDKVYDILKWIVLVFLPALTTLVGVIGSVYGWANLEPILTIMTAVTTFLGAILGVSTAQYNQKNKEQ